MVGREVRVTVGHGDRFVADQLLDHLDIYSLHHGPANVSVPQSVPDHISQASLLRALEKPPVAVTFS